MPPSMYFHAFFLAEFCILRTISEDLDVEIQLLKVQSEIAVLDQQE